MPVGTYGSGAASPTQTSVAPAAECADMWSRFLRFCHRFNLSYWAIRIAGYLARRLPVRLGYAVSRVIGYFVYYTWRTQRDAVIANMRQVLGPEAPERLVRRRARRAYVNYFDYIVDFLRFPKLTPADLERVVESRGWEHLDRALAAGKGVIFVTLHIGCFDFASAVVANRGYKVNVIAESFEPPKLNELIQRQRRLDGINIIPLENPTRPIIGALRRNELLALLVDRPMPDGVTVDFFGAPTSMPAGAAALALKTGATVLPGYLIRRPNDTYYGQIDPAIEYEPTGDPQRDIRALSQRIMHALEAVVRQYPDQWYMFRRMWPETRQA